MRKVIFKLKILIKLIPKNHIWWMGAYVLQKFIYLQYRLQQKYITLLYYYINKIRSFNVFLFINKNLIVLMKQTVKIAYKTYLPLICLKFKYYFYQFLMNVL